MDKKTVYAELRGIDVSGMVEKKNGLSYLSWAHALDQLLQRDPEATWEYLTFPESIGPESTRMVPYLEVFGTYMVFCKVNAFGVSRTFQLPVLDYKNKPIMAPTAMDLNTTMQRCLAKTIASHGIGINLYAGEDLPLAAKDAAAGFIADLTGARDMNELDEIASHVKEFTAVYPSFRKELSDAYSTRKEKLGGGEPKVVPDKGVAGLKQRLANKEAS